MQPSMIFYSITSVASLLAIARDLLATRRENDFRTPRKSLPKRPLKAPGTAFWGSQDPLLSLNDPSIKRLQSTTLE